MSEKIFVPVLGESITEATVVKWLKNKGDNVEIDEPIVELETDKVNLEVPSPVNGILDEINAKNGEVVQVGAALGLVTESTNKSEKKITSQNNKDNIINLDLDKKNETPQLFVEEENNLKDSEAEPLILTDAEPLILTNEIKEEKSTAVKEVKENLSPAVRKIVVENNIDIEKVRGSGKD